MNAHQCFSACNILYTIYSHSSYRSNPFRTLCRKGLNQFHHVQIFARRLANRVQRYISSNQMSIAGSRSEWETHMEQLM